jgi:fibronectin-binding autotransporter adhesin
MRPLRRNGFTLVELLILRHRSWLIIVAGLSALAASPAAAQTWTGAVSGSWTDAGNWSPAGVPVSGPNTQLIFGAAANAAMTDDIAGAFALNSMTFNAGGPAFTLGGNGLAFQSNTAGGLPQILTNSANNTTFGTAVSLLNNVTVSGSGSLALNGPVGGVGGLTMLGTGTVSLGGNNTYSGGTAVLNGTVSVAADTNLGTGNVVGAALGTFNFTGSTMTPKSFAMNGGTISVAVGKTMTFNGGQVSGAFLDGAGTFATPSGPNGAQFVNVTATASVSLMSNSTNDQFKHFDNSGKLNVAAGLNSAGTSTTVNFNGFTNEGLGSITLGAAAQINVSNFQSYGTLTLIPATVGANPHQETLLKNVGTAPLGFGGGSRTVLGTPQTGGLNFVAGIDLNGVNAIVLGGLFNNNGFVIDSSNNGAGTGAVIAHYGSRVSGGYFQNPVQTVPGASFESGMGAASFGRFVFGPGGVGNYVFAIDDATGTAGPATAGNGPAGGWGLVKAIRQTVLGTTSLGDFTWTATPTDKLTVALDTIINPSATDNDVAGLMANFDPSRSYVWTAVQWAGTYSGPAAAADLNSSTAFDTSGFLNPIDGTFGWSLDTAGQTLSLVYTPTAVPEPGSLAFAGLAAAGLTFWRRRGRSTSRANRGTVWAERQDDEPRRSRMD